MLVNPWIYYTIHNENRGMENEKEILIKLGKKISHLRKLRKMTQEDLAFKADLDRSYIGRIERAECTASVPVLIKISRALKTDMPTLFSFDNPAYQNSDIE